MRGSLERRLHREAGWICDGCWSKVTQRSYHSSRVRGHEWPPIPRTKLAHQKNYRHAYRDHRSISASPILSAASTRKSKLPDRPARTRFAPSPTGYLHIGGLRTALFSYLLAKSTGGQFILRIEDTDRKRLVPGAEDRLCDELRWAGLRWDEGPDIDGPHGPYKQSLRNDIYQKHSLHLLNAGEAYRCFCTPQTAGEAKAAYVTSGCYQNCSSLPADQSEEKATQHKQLYTIRLRQPLDAHKRIYPDLIYGKIQRLKRSPSAPLTASEDDAALDASDTILVKSDGTPTYHFANVVDDHLMGITHVIRGSEWMASTPLHYDIYSAFDWRPPQFAHVGLLVDQNKAKLSKRNADLALDVTSMREQHGILPGPLINFLALLGWSNPTNNDVMELHELIQNFDLKFTKGNAMARMEKLWFLQKAHVARLWAQFHETQDAEPVRPIVDQVVDEVPKHFPQPITNKEIVPSDGTDELALVMYTLDVLSVDNKSYENAAQFVHRNRYFFAFDAAEVPTEQEYYNKAGTIRPDMLKSLVRRAFALLMPPPNDRSPVESAGDAGGEVRPAGMDGVSLEQRISSVLLYESWMAAIDFQTYPSLSGTAEESSHSYSVDVTAEQKADFLQMLLHQGNAQIGSAGLPLEMKDGDPADLAVLDNRQKAVHGAIMKYLREKLSLGLPGPHMSQVMAVLGLKECARRLGLSDQEN